MPCTEFTNAAFSLVRERWNPRSEGDDGEDPHQEVDYLVDDCFFAVGQAIGTSKRLEPEAVIWWRRRHRSHFLHALTVLGNSWACDRDRVTNVARHLGARAVHYAGSSASIDLDAAVKASLEIEAGCRMHAERETGFTGCQAPKPANNQARMVAMLILPAGIRIAASALSLGCDAPTGTGHSHSEH